MKKTSKILSLLVALCMAVTMLSGLTVFAADPFELVSYDADADFITLDFNQAIDLETSQFIVLHGKEYLEAGVDFAIAKADANSNVQADGVSSRYTYKVTLEDGIVLGDEYTVSFWDVKSSDGASTLAQSALTFTVAELATDADLVDIVPYKWGNNNTWVRDEETGGMMIESWTAGNNMSYWSAVGARVGADTTEEHILPNKSLPAGSANWTETDYTVKATIKSSNTTRATVNFGIASDLQNIHGETATGAKFTGIKTYDYAAMSTTAHDAAYYIMKNSNYRSDSASRAAYFARTSAPDLNFEAGFEFKVSSKDGVVRAFLNGAKLMDGEVEVNAGYPFLSMNPNGVTTDTTAKVQIYNFQVTQSTVEEIEVVAPEGYIPPEPDEEEAPAAILDWNADLDFFTVDFEEEIASMDATITQAGEIIPAGAYLSNSSTMYADNAARCTWIVKPNAGFVADIPYTVSIANVKDAEGNVVLANWTKTFKVEVIDDGITYPGTPSTKTNHYTAGGTLTQLADGKGLKFQNSGDSGANNKFAYAVGEDTNATKAIGSASSTPNAVYTANDYTVKATFKLGGSSGAKIGIAHTYAVNTNYNYDHGWFRGIGAYVNVYAGTADEETGIKPMGKTGSTVVYSTKYIDSAVNKTIREQSYDEDTGKKALKNLNGAEGIELKLAMKNDSANFFIDGAKSCDIVSYGENGCLSLSWTPSIGSTGGVIEDAWCEITDIVITKATHLDVTGASFTYEDATVDEGAIAGQETVNIILPVINNTLATKTLFAVCAIYDATGAMKNIVISEVDEATSGNNEVTFENVEVNGGTYAKIFLWDSSAALNPWFPAIEVE